MQWKEDPHCRGIWVTTDTPERVAVHHYHGCGDAWFVSCHRLGVELVELQQADLADAQLEAEQIIRDVVARWVDALGEK